MPFLVAVDVTGTNSVTVRFQEPDSHDSPICTKFKVQWSIKEDFSVVCGEREVLDMKQRECRIDDLIQGQKYYFRAAAGNLKGYSRFRNSTPANVTPSSKIISNLGDRVMRDGSSEKRDRCRVVEFRVSIARYIPISFGVFERKLNR